MEQSLGIVGFHNDSCEAVMASVLLPMVPHYYDFITVVVRLCSFGLK